MHESIEKEYCLHCGQRKKPDLRHQVESNSKKLEEMSAALNHLNFKFEARTGDRGMGEEHYAPEQMDTFVFKLTSLEKSIGFFTETINDIKLQISNLGAGHIKLQEDLEALQAVFQGHEEDHDMAKLDAIHISKDAMSYDEFATNPKYQLSEDEYKQYLQLRAEAQKRDCECEQRKWEEK